MNLQPIHASATRDVLPGSRAPYFDKARRGAYDGRNLAVRPCRVAFHPNEQVSALMFTAWLRKISRWLVEPFAALLARLGLTPNALTIIGCLLNIGVAVIIAQGHLLWGGVALAAASGFDALDGTLARQLGRSTKFGAFLDSVLDRVSESAVLLGLAYYYMGRGGTTEEFLAFVAIVGSLLVSYTRARAEGLQIDCKGGILTRVERCLLLIAALILNLTTPALWILAGGTTFTTIQRIWHVRRALADAAL